MPSTVDGFKPTLSTLAWIFVCNFSASSFILAIIPIEKLSLHRIHIILIKHKFNWTISWLRKLEKIFRRAYRFIFNLVSINYDKQWPVNPDIKTWKYKWCCDEINDNNINSINNTYDKILKTDWIKKLWALIVIFYQFFTFHASNSFMLTF